MSQPDFKAEARELRLESLLDDEDIATLAAWGQQMYERGVRDALERKVPCETMKGCDPDVWRQAVQAKNRKIRALLPSQGGAVVGLPKEDGDG